MPVMENAEAVALRRATFAIPASLESAGLARKMTEVVLHAWDSPVDDFTAVLLLSEVFTNAVLHGVETCSDTTASIGVDLVETVTGLHVEVHDPNEGKRYGVALEHPTAQSESGRGLELVEELSTAWGCKYTPTGKFVFFDVDGVAPRPSGAESARLVRSAMSGLVCDDPAHRDERLAAACTDDHVDIVGDAREVPVRAQVPVTGPGEVVSCT